jgi:hypothetical protein
MKENSYIFFGIVLAVLEFELRDSHLLGNYWVTWATLPDLFCIAYLQVGVPPTIWATVRAYNLSDSGETRGLSWGPVRERRSSHKQKQNNISKHGEVFHCAGVDWAAHVWILSKGDLRKCNSRTATPTVHSSKHEKDLWHQFSLNTKHSPGSHFKAVTCVISDITSDTKHQPILQHQMGFQQLNSDITQH